MEDKKMMTKRLISVMKDDLKDSEMLFGYAKDEREAGNNEMASWYLTKARNRLDMFQKVDEKIQDHMRKKSYGEDGEKEEKDMGYKCFYDHLVEEASELSQKVSKFKM